ncbi:MAG: helix-turn-helix domain-containing protein [Lachnospiraceae bacterium]|jgi:excisionase family DNA binding protein|nr:helix-turn-helix domain-containing protein [Lachnospiraceae bacterium]MBQ1735237.1 helix-turn-helix domain-containing protein [Lachnospiraceae bacterium]
MPGDNINAVSELAETAVSTSCLRNFADMLTTQEVCELFHVSRPTIYHLVANHELTAIRIGSKNLYPKASVKALIEKRTR